MLKDSGAHYHDRKYITIHILAQMCDPLPILKQTRITQCVQTLNVI